MAEAKKGYILKISGPLVIIGGFPDARVLDMMRVGKEGLIGEVVRLEGERAFVQVYENTSALMVGEPVEDTGAPLSVELGPGLLGSVLDGIGRPLEEIKKISGFFISRGLVIPTLDRKKKWEFKPAVKVGDKVEPGDVLGIVPERPTLPHKVLVPPGVSGTIKSIRAGSFTVDEDIAELDNGRKLQLSHKWPVKKPRPFKKKLDPTEPFITGQRVLDALFPIALGGCACIPGGFGTGKTVVEQMLAKYCSAQVIVYIGCGERGNEMTEVLREFPELSDPQTGGKLMDRTILVVNTSNMPVAAREASVYTGITLAEYYRDQGYNVALMADSTSRWAEAMREMGSRLEEMPGEEGFPTYLASRLANFYERTGRVICVGKEGRMGSVTAVGAVSPPGGDFSEPVTQNSMRVTGALWSLDSSLAHRRHFPAINWNRSYTLYFQFLDEWYKKNLSPDWAKIRVEAMDLLKKDAELQEVVQLVGPDALQDKERMILESSKMIREDFLQQDAFSAVDATCTLKKQLGMMKTIVTFYEEGEKCVGRGTPIEDILKLPLREEVSRMKEIPEKDFPKLQKEMVEKITRELGALGIKEAKAKPAAAAGVKS